MMMKLAAIFGDHMVLCRQKEIRLFGEATDGSTLIAEMNGATGCTVARAGRFELTLPPMEAGGPYELTVTDGQTTLRFADVMVGAVYLAGGQSNMEMELRNAKDGEKFAAEANLPEVRFYNTPKIAFWDEASEKAERESRWQTLQNCGGMSAVAFHFALNLYAELNIPIGIIDCYWGGTSVTCWLDEAALRGCEEGRAYLTEYAARTNGQTDEQYDAAERAFENAMTEWNARVEDERRKGASGDEARQLAGPCPWNPPAGRKSPFRPAGLVHTMLMRVAPYTLTGVLYYQGEEDTPHADRYRALLTALIRRWRELFRDETLPFLLVQLPMFIEAGRAEDGHWPALRQAQAEAAQDQDNVEMAVLIDCGEYDNVHPLDKEPVGKRLCLLALKQMGKLDDGSAESPRALSFAVVGSELRVSLSAEVRCTGDVPALLELAGEDGAFAPAEATLAEEGRTLRLTAQAVPQPRQARYAWVSFGKVNLFGKNGLPLAPFWMK